MNAVIDTNVIVSRYINWRGTPGRILQRWLEGAYQALVSTPILDEYQEVLSCARVRRYHKMTDAEILQAIDVFRRLGRMIEPRETIRAVAADPSDDKFLECAVAGEADFVVSGDPHLVDLRRFRGIEIVSPATFLAFLERDVNS